MPYCAPFLVILVPLIIDTHGTQIGSWVILCYIGHPHALQVGFLGYTGAAEFDETLPHLEAACAYFAEAQPEACKLIHNVSEALNRSALPMSVSIGSKDVKRLKP